VLGVGTLEYLQKFLQCIKYIILQFTPPQLSFIPSPQISGIVSTGMLCIYTHMYTVFFRYGENSFCENLKLHIAFTYMCLPGSFLIYAISFKNFCYYFLKHCSPIQKLGADASILKWFSYDTLL
jgi:hypothetical protein